MKLNVYIAIGCLLWSTSVLAQNAVASEDAIREAKKAFVAGRQAYESGEFPKALSNFETAYRLTENADLLYNIATVADRMRRDEQALKAYEEYIRERPNSLDREHIEGRIRVLRGSLVAKARAERETQERLKEATERAAEEAREAEYRKVSPGAGPWIMIGASSAAAVSGAILVALGRKDANAVENADVGTDFDSVQAQKERAPKRTKTGAALLGLGAAGGLGGVIWQIVGWKEEKIPNLRISRNGIKYVGRF